MKPPRRVYLTMAKAVATLGILAIVIHKVPLRDVAARLAQIDAPHLLLLAAVTLAQVGVSVVRWWRLLARLGERVSLAALLGDSLVGLAYNMFLPTTVGGDVVRAWRASRRVSVAHRAWSTSMFERLAGLLTMAVTGALAALFAVSSSGTIPASLRWVAVVLAAAFLVAFFLVRAPLRWLAHLLENRLGKSSPTRDLRGVVADLEGPLAGAGARVETLAWSLLYQALGIVFVIIGASAIGAPGHATAILVGVPLIHVLSIAPITLGGHGLREGLFVGVLGELGVAPDVALGLAAQWLASSALFAVAGAAVALSRAGAPRAAETSAPSTTEA